DSCRACVFRVNGAPFNCAIDCSPVLHAPLGDSFGFVFGTTSCAGIFANCPAGTRTDTATGIAGGPRPPVTCNGGALNGLHCCCF
ncbi:unnamed protein product, partial [Rotaria sp. Silwood2]